MITTKGIRNVDHVAYDEVWGIVRSLKNKADYMEHVPEHLRSDIFAGNANGSSSKET